MKDGKCQDNLRRPGSKDDQRYCGPVVKTLPFNAEDMGFQSLVSELRSHIHCGPKKPKI